MAAPEAPAATASTTLMTDSASSTATSTPPIEEPKPVEEAAEVRGRRSAPIMGSEPLVDLGRLPELLHRVRPIRERPIGRRGRRTRIRQCGAFARSRLHGRGQRDRVRLVRLHLVFGPGDPVGVR